MMQRRTWMLLAGGTALASAGAGLWWRSTRQPAPGTAAPPEDGAGTLWSMQFDRPEGGSLAERIRRRCPEYLGEDAGNDMQGWQLEEFGLPLNLMLAVPCVMVVGDAEAALQRLRRDLDARHRVA